MVTKGMLTKGMAASGMVTKGMVTKGMVRPTIGEHIIRICTLCAGMVNTADLLSLPFK